jgi:aspartyl protease family protein
MQHEPSNPRRICPHCGAENTPAAETRGDGRHHSGAERCVTCGRSLPSMETADPPHARPHGRFSTLNFLLIAGVLIALMAYLNYHFGALTADGGFGRIVYEILIVLVISASLASGRIVGNLKYLAIWGLIFMVLMVGYSYRHELAAVKQKVFAELIPANGYATAPGSIGFPMSSDGHFYIRAEVDGVPITFLADTGASSIVLTPADAKRIGIAVDRLHFDRIFETANGMVRGSSIRIAEFRVGGLHLRDIGASVNEAAMSESLLGMTFFKRLKRYAVKDGVLTLYW